MPLLKRKCLFIAYRRQTLAVEHVTEAASDLEAETYVLLLASLCLLFQVRFKIFIIFMEALFCLFKA